MQNKTEQGSRKMYIMHQAQSCESSAIQGYWKPVCIISRVCVTTFIPSGIFMGVARCWTITVVRWRNKN